MALAVRLRKQGGPEVMVLEDVQVPPPGPGEATLHHAAVGLNFIDVYQRNGHYPLQLPSGLGQEAAGVVTAVGPGVTTVRVGERVAYAGAPLGAYAEARNYPADRLVPVPEGVSDEAAAASLLKGLTAWYLVRRTYKVERGQTVLVHAAAGGVGLILCQWLRHLGATVIGTVGSEQKAQAAREAGCTHPLVLDGSNRRELPAKVKELTGGAKVPVVYDSVGKDTFDVSLESLAPFGLMVLFGASSGAVPPFDLQRLAAGGSLYVTRPTLVTYSARREDLLAGARELFDLVARGAITIHVNQRYPLREVARAHMDLEARKTTGSTVLLP
ncbi:MAG TPA: quinone oxidoreductase [Myxococcaceae bacterium]|nr:quinone oxidoreductase [Myxococcaceae bacterium]